MDKVLSVCELTYHYPSNGSTKNENVFENMSFELNKGELLCIVGPSGCGKTTLLNLISGFLLPSEGKIALDGETKNKGHRIGYIFQSDALLPWRTVLGNILIGLEISGYRHEEAMQERGGTIEDYLQTFNLKQSILDKYPNQLSMGMRQRVAIIQSLMCDPDILLLDEPFSALDFYTKLRLENEFWNMVQKNKKAAILVTHDIEEAIAMGHRVLLMGHSPQGIVREFRINFDICDRFPEAVRGEQIFIKYFNSIWMALKGMVESA